MAFTATAQSGEFHYLAEFMLDSTTLRYADTDLLLKTGTYTGAFYQGRLGQSAVLSRNLGSFLQPRETINTFVLPVDNSDGVVSGVIRSATFANREVRLWIGEGKFKDNYSLVYRGTVAHPNGIRWNERAAEFTVVDKRASHRRYIPPPSQTFFLTTYPRVEGRYKYTPIPVVYGDFSSAAASGVAIPVACSDTSTLKFKVASHALKSVDKFMLNGVRLNPRTAVVSFASTGVSLSDASFYLSGQAYNATTDTLSVNCQGIQSANGTLLTLAPDVMKNMLTAYLGVSGGDLNGTAFNDWATDGDAYQVRRFIRTSTSSEILLSELLAETQTDLRFVNGQYSPKLRQPDVISSRLAIGEADIILADQQQEVADFAVDNDPDRLYTNYIKARWQWDPANGQFVSSKIVSADSAEDDVLGRYERSMDFNWMYQSSEVDNRVARELYIYSTEPVTVELGLARRAILQDLADQIDLTYNAFTAKTLQIRALDINLGQMTARVRGYDVFSTGFGKWTADGAPTYSAATPAQRLESGYWCNAAGLANGGIPTSDISRWY